MRIAFKLLVLFILAITIKSCAGSNTSSSPSPRPNIDPTSKEDTICNDNIADADGNASCFDCICLLASHRVPDDFNDSLIDSRLDSTGHKISAEVVMYKSVDTTLYSTYTQMSEEVVTYESGDTTDSYIRMTEHVVRYDSIDDYKILLITRNNVVQKSDTVLLTRHTLLDWLERNDTGWKDGRNNARYIAGIYKLEDDRIISFPFKFIDKDTVSFMIRMYLFDSDLSDEFINRKWCDGDTLMDISVEYYEATHSDNW